MTRAFFNQKAATWDESGSESDMAKLKEMTERLEIRPGARLLDVGSGTGILLPFLLSKIGNSGQIVAIDYAEEMLKIARIKYLSNTVHYLQADVDHLPLRNELFDAAICYSSFPHFRHKLESLLEINRVIKDSGRLTICHTSSRSEINGLHHEIPTLANDVIPDENEMKAILLQAGFNNIKIEDNTHSYLATAQKRRRS